MVFGGFRVGWDLKECNDRLVAYIDRYAAHWALL